MAAELQPLNWSARGAAVQYDSWFLRLALSVGIRSKALTVQGIWPFNFLLQNIHVKSEKEWFPIPTSTIGEWLQYIGFCLSFCLVFLVLVLLSAYNERVAVSRMWDVLSISSCFNWAIKCPIKNYSVLKKIFQKYKKGSSYSLPWEIYPQTAYSLQPTVHSTLYIVHCTLSTKHNYP